MVERRRLSMTARFSSPGTPKIRSTPSFSSAATRRSDPFISHPFCNPRVGPSVWRCLARSLQPRGFDPPCQIVREAWKRCFELLSALCRRRAIRRQRLRNGADGEGGRYDDHAHLRKRTVPGGRRPRSCNPSCRIAGDGGGTPEPFLEKVIGEVLQSRLHSPIIFARDENKPVGAADLV